MRDKKIIKESKKTKILAHNLFQKPSVGNYFNHKHGNFSQNISVLRNSIDVNSFKFLIKTIEQLPVKFNLLGEKKIKLKDLFKDILHYKNFDSEFFWAKNIISNNVDKINIYLNYKNEYSSLILYGKYDEAEGVLTKIENEFGESLWLIKNKISFYQLSEGLERQKKYTNAVKKQLQNGSLTKFLIHYISVRNENNVTVPRFRNQLEPILLKLNDVKQEGFKEFIIYHLFEKEELQLDEIIQIVRLSYSFSIIDYYESFISLLKVLSYNNFDDNNKTKAKNFLNTYLDEFNDLRLQNLAFVHDIKISEKLFDLESVNVFENILNGKYDPIIIENLEQGRNISLNILMFCYQKMILNNVDSKSTNDDLLSRILNGLSKILRKGISGSQDEYIALQKIIVNFSSFSWTGSIKMILNKENLIYEKIVIGSDFDICNLEIIHPIAIDYILNKHSSVIYEKKFSEVYPDSEPISLIKSIKEGALVSDGQISEQFFYYSNSLINYENGNYSEAVIDAEKLLKCNIPYYTRKANGIISYSYVKLENYKLLCKVITNVYLNDRNQYTFLPLNDLSQIFLPKTLAWNECKSEIDLSIVLDIFLRHYNTSASQTKLLVIRKRYAYEDFLTSKGIIKPSELQFEKPLSKNLTYFFRYICQESMMELTGSFKGGSAEVLEERLKICRILLENDDNNTEIYRSEIEEIVRRQVITSRRKEVDQSRVFVDVKSIKEWAEKELSESYSRYISYLKVGLDKSPTKKALTSATVIYTPEDEANELFIFMIEEVRSAYLSSDIGLDRFISTRIRHGELERTMRIPIQKHHLITKKLKKDGPYLKNDYWLSKMCEANSNLISINKSFEKFSNNFDLLISEIAQEWLQIKSTDKANGLFDFSFLISDFNRLYNEVKYDTSLTEFIEFTIAFLDNKLIMILINIQEQLSNKGKNNAKNLLLSLNDDIEKECDTSNIELKRAINQSRIDLGLQFDKVINWFNPSIEGNSAPYTIEDAVYVAEAIIRESDSQFEINMLQEDKDNYPIHGQLPSLIDIFINIFDNVVKRSGLDHPVVKIIVSKELISDEIYTINMTFSNKLGDKINIDSVESILKTIKHKVEKNDYLKDVAKEHKSGLIKIYKTINDFSIIEADVKAHMDFYIIEERFEIKISIPFKLYSIALEEIEENII